MTEHIRWADAPGHSYAEMAGYAGNLDEPLFKIYPPDTFEDCWIISCQLPGYQTRRFTAEPDAGADALKAEAERWLSDFITSLGASFPDEPAACDFPVIPPGQIEAEVAVDIRRMTHPPIAPVETGEPWRGPAQADWDGSR